MSDVTVTSQANLQNEVRSGDHTFITDEPSEAGGDDAGPDPYTLLLGALGSCISMTTMLFAATKRVGARAGNRASTPAKNSRQRL